MSDGRELYFSGLLFIRSKQFFFSCVSETASVNHASHACCKNGGTSYVVRDVLLFDRLCVERCVGVQKKKKKKKKKRFVGA